MHRMLQQGQSYVPPWWWLTEEEVARMRIPLKSVERTMTPWPRVGRSRKSRRRRDSSSSSLSPSLSPPMRPQDAGRRGLRGRTPPLMRPSDARTRSRARMRPLDAGPMERNKCSHTPWILATLGFLFAFIAGAAFGTGGSPHLNTAVSYLRLHVFNRGAAQDLQLWANAAGLPLNIAQPGELPNIIGTVVALSFAWRRVRG